VVKTQLIIIARVGFMDTIDTYGIPGMFYRLFLALYYVDNYADAFLGLSAFR
jgi:hypothetical protein